MNVNHPKVRLWVASAVHHGGVAATPICRHAADWPAVLNMNRIEAHQPALPEHGRALGEPKVRDTELDHRFVWVRGGVPRRVSARAAVPNAAALPPDPRV